MIQGKRQTERREAKWVPSNRNWKLSQTLSCLLRQSPERHFLFVLVNRRWRAIRFHRRDMLTYLPTTTPHPTDIQLWIFSMHYRIVSVLHRSVSSMLFLSVFFLLVAYSSTGAGTAGSLTSSSAYGTQPVGGSNESVQLVDGCSLSLSGSWCQLLSPISTITGLSLLLGSWLSFRLQSQLVNALVESIDSIDQKFTRLSTRISSTDHSRSSESIFNAKCSLVAQFSLAID